MAFRPIRVVLFMSMGRDEPIRGVLFIPNNLHENGDAWWNGIDGGNRRTRRKICPSATLSATNPTWTEPGKNTGLHGERHATNGLSHGTASHVFYIINISTAPTLLECSTCTGVLSATATDHYVRMNPTIILKNVILYEYKRSCILCTQYDNKLLYYYSSGCIYTQNGATLAILVNTTLRQKHVN
jgi:hypothetical protein